MGQYKNKTYPLRLEGELMEKVRAIADKEDRPLSKQLERIVREYVHDYESQNGNIKINMLNNEGTIHNVNM